MTGTPLDRAHAAMEAAPKDEACARAFYARLAAAELFVLLAEEPAGDEITPELFDLGDQRFVLAFDTEERLSDFAERIVPYVALSGRAVAQMLAGQGIGLAFNIEVAPSATLLPSEAVDWLAGTLAGEPTETEARPEEISAPLNLPDALLTALDARLAGAEGMARMAYLVGARYAGGASGHLLGFVDAPQGAEAALARAVQEALVFSGLDAGAIDVAFFDASDPVAATLARHGLRFDLPQPAKGHVPGAPGSDPDRPPKLR